jgi:eukaryotic-like serine/threonine-protein kinase
MPRSRSRARTTRAESALVPPPLEGRLVGYRLLRRIATGDRADLYLAVADADPDADADPEDAAHDGASAATLPLVAVRVYPADADDAIITTEIEAMSSDASGTLPRLIDVATLDDGRCCVVVERIGGPTLSRLLIERTVSAGEAVTILAPIVVAIEGLAEQGLAHAALAASDILLDDAGRPRLIGLGGLRRAPASAAPGERIAQRRAGLGALAELIEHVAASVRPANALDGVVEFLRDRLDARPFLPFEAELERRLFAVAAPEPVGGVMARSVQPRLPGRVTAPHEITTTSAAGGADATSVSVTTDAPRTRLRQIFALAELPGGLTDRLADAADGDHVAGLRRRMAGMLHRRGRSAAVGALLGGGALVLMLTLVPPATPDAERPSAGVMSDPVASVIEPVAPDSPETSPTGVAAPVEPPPIEQPENALEAGRRLLEHREECFATLDLACLEAVVQAGSAIEARDRTSIQAARDGLVVPEPEFDLMGIEVAAEMGAAVLLRIPRTVGEREPASLLVVRGEAGWRLRELFD